MDFYVCNGSAGSIPDDQLWRTFSRSAPKEINSAFGYRTSMSMKNADTWQFAHHYFGKIWRTLGWILIIPSVIPMLFVIGKGNDPVGNMA